MPGVSPDAYTRNYEDCRARKRRRCGSRSRAAFSRGRRGWARFVIVNAGDVPATAVLSMEDLTDLQDDLELMSVLLSTRRQRRPEES